MADLSNKVVVVTGATRGLGRGLAEGLAEAGATVYVTGRTSVTTSPSAQDTVEATARRVEALGGIGRPFPADHASAVDVRRLFEWVRAEQGRLDVLVNHLPPGREVCRDCALAVMVQQGHGLIVELVSAEAPEPPAVPVGVTVLQLVPCPDTARFNGRCVAALAMDPDIGDKSGGTYRVDELVREYRFSDPGDPVPGAATH
jgi:hypothetical protein